MLVQTFVHALRRAEAVAAAREALVCGDTRLTYREFAERLRRLHGGLRELGIERGERVGILSFNSIPFTELYCGISMSGRVQVPLNFRWAEPELAYAIEDSGAKVLFCDRDPGALADLVERVVRIERGEYEAIVAGATPVELDDDAVGEDDVAGLFYTGGTTGVSKGVMLTHRNLVANAWNMQITQPLTADDRYLVMAPMFHAAGSISLLQAIFMGASQIIMPAFDPATMLDVVESEAITQTLGVPTMVAASVEEQLARPRDVGTFRAYAHGGSPIAIEVLRRGAEAFPGTSFIHLYGATETAPLVTGLANEVELLGTERQKSAGQPVMGCQVVIRDSDGEPLPAAPT
jgi:long-chain acyl-CoA synthetase